MLNLKPSGRIALGGAVGSKFSVFVSIVLLAAFAAGCVFLFFLLEREEPKISLASDVSHIGQGKEIGFSLSDEKSGLQSFSVAVEQNGKISEIMAENFPRQGYYRQAGPSTIERTARIEAATIGLKDGAAALVITARDFSYWNFMSGNVTIHRVSVMIDTAAPKIRLVDLPRYITGGGSSIVVYQLSEPVEKHGAMINGHFYPGVPVSASDNQKFAALLAIEHDAEGIGEMFLTATDKAGNIGKTPFSMVFRRGKSTVDQLNLSDSFFATKLPEFMGVYPDIPGTTDLERFLYINGKMRQENEAKIKEITSVATPERHWKGILGRLPRASKRAGFAEHRSYLYNNQKVDAQVHLGIDLASVRHAPVTAANTGKVVFADYLGIYGNMVILDHGWGLYTLYSHLSQISVAVGDLVQTDQELGNTGATGMAGGDHLHFGIVVNGVFVNPLEWWDDQWVQLNLLSFI